MSARFAALGWSSTPMGELVLRRRWDATVGRDVYEVKLDDDFLMSSLFTVSETELARRALAELPATELDVVVGGLDLGYTARTVLENPGVRSVTVIEALGDVIEWHRQGLVPAAVALTSDRRCSLVRGDFFAMARTATGLDPTVPGRRFHAIIVDIDHSPRHVLHPSHAEFYEPEGLRRLTEHLHPGGVFALWSNDPPDQEFAVALAQSFAEVRAEVVSFDNPLQRQDAASTVYVARRP